MKPKIMCLFALLACLTGCVPVDSLNPLYTNKDVVFDESLLGFWVGPKNGEDGGLRFSRLSALGEKSYVITLTGDRDGDSMVLHAHLVKLGGKQFLDVMPTQWEANPDSYVLKVKSNQSGPDIEPGLLRLARAFYLEFERGSSAGEAKANLRRAHWFIKLIRTDKTLKLAWADDDDIKKAVQSGSMQLPTQLLGDGNSKDVVITAGTKEIQKFVTEHADDERFFSGGTGQLHRKE
jgi:hypothetical protein